MEEFQLAIVDPIAHSAISTDIIHDTDHCLIVDSDQLWFYFMDKAP